MWPHSNVTREKVLAIPTMRCISHSHLAEHGRVQLRMPGDAGERLRELAASARPCRQVVIAPCCGRSISHSYLAEGLPRGRTHLLMPGEARGETAGVACVSTPISPSCHDAVLRPQPSRTELRHRQEGGRHIDHERRLLLLYAHES